MRQVTGTGRSTSFRVLVGCGLGLLGACFNTSPSEPLEVTPWGGDFSFAFADPQDDTFPLAAGETGEPLDVLSIEGEVTETLLTIRLTFATPVVSWTNDEPNSIDGFLDFDIDENSATGISAAVDDAGGNSGIGTDFSVLLRDNGTGGVALVQWVTGNAAIIPVTFAGTLVTIEVPRAAFRDGDGEFRMASVFGQGTRPTTDFAPNTSHSLVHRPQP